MRLNEFFADKYICFKNKLGATVFWNENGLGYTGNIQEAGLFTDAEVNEKFRLNVLTSKEIERGLHKRYTHFALKLSDAIKYFY